MSRPKILIIDDEHLVRDFIAEVLAEEDFDLYFAVDGQDGLQQAISLQPDLIFLDICMPVLDGLSFLRKFHQLTASPCPIIAMTGYNDDTVLNACYKMDVFVLIQKPLQLNEVAALAHRYTRRPQLKKKLTIDSETVKSLGRQASSFDVHSTAIEYFIEAIPFPGFIKDKERTFVQLNSAFENLTGLQRDEILGKTCHELNLKLMSDEEEELETELLSKGGVLDHEITVRCGLQHPRKMIIYRSAIKEKKHKNAIGILGFAIDKDDLGLSSFKKELSLKYPSLSPRECEVAQLIREGMQTKEIARQLHISLSTVDYHRNNLREKLGIKGGSANLCTTLLSI